MAAMKLIVLLVLGCCAVQQVHGIGKWDEGITRCMGLVKDLVLTMDQVLLKVDLNLNTINEQMPAPANEKLGALKANINEISDNSTRMTTTAYQTISNSSIALYENKGECMNEFNGKADPLILECLEKSANSIKDALDKNPLIKELFDAFVQLVIDTITAIKTHIAALEKASEPGKADGNAMTEATTSLIETMMGKLLELVLKLSDLNTIRDVILALFDTIMGQTKECLDKLAPSIQDLGKCAESSK